MKATLATLLLTSALLTSNAHAQQLMCGPVKQVEVELQAAHGEFPFWRGLDDKGNVVTLFVHPSTGSWTLVFTPPHLPDMYCQGSQGETSKPIPLNGKTS